MSIPVQIPHPPYPHLPPPHTSATCHNNSHKITITITTSATLAEEVFPMAVIREVSTCAPFEAFFQVPPIRVRVTESSSSESVRVPVTDIEPQEAVSIDSQILTIAFGQIALNRGGLPPLYHKEDGMWSQILGGVSGNCLRLKGLRVSKIILVKREGEHL